MPRARWERGKTRTQGDPDSAGRNLHLILEY